MPVTQLTPPPSAPSRQNSLTFSDMLDAFLAWIITFVSQLNALVIQISGWADTATSGANTATAQAVISTQAAAASSQSANFHGEWAGLTGAAAVPFSVYHGGKYWALLTNVSDITAKTPGSATEWAPITTPSAASSLYLQSTYGGF